MRTTTLRIGVVLAAAALLTGCSAGAPAEPAAETPSASASTPPAAEAPSSDCPELAEGVTIDGPTLGGCIVDALDGISGYAGTTTTMGMESTTRYNPAEKAISTESSFGSMIVIGSDAWVKSPSSDWQVADATSSDPIIAALSTAATSATSVDPTAVAASLSGEFTVTGTGERLGQTVYLLSGSSEQQGVAVDAVFELTSGYESLATTTSTTVNGQAVEITMVVTEWDVKQDIVAPL